jgi:hypothetical protein
VSDESAVLCGGNNSVVKLLRKLMNFSEAAEKKYYLCAGEIMQVLVITLRYM